jgi:serine/threonine protein kinase
VKVLDFGLAAKLDERSASTSGERGDLTHSPTLTFNATQAGIILGTAAYMSPEQAAGKPVDKRSDLWAFGLVLMEMLTGRSVFTGETVSHVLAAVLRAEPDWGALPANTPAPIRRLLRRCLDKDRRRRLADSADARLEIEDVLAGAPEDIGAIAPSTTATPIWRRVLPWAGPSALGVGLAQVLLLGAVAVGASRRAAAGERRARRRRVAGHHHGERRGAGR